MATIGEWSEEMDLGGTMRLGQKRTDLTQQGRVTAAYGQQAILERHRHRYEVNTQYVAQLEAAGMVCSGMSEEGLVDVVELVDHPWYVGCQYHPEFQSNPHDGHPLFNAFIAAGMKRSQA